MNIKILALLTALFLGIAAALYAATRAVYSCPDAVWSGSGSLVVSPKGGVIINGELGFCPDGLVLWRENKKAN